MDFTAIKAAWVVTAGPIDGLPDPSLERVYLYTESDYATDQAQPQPNPATSVFGQRQAQAVLYLGGVSSPATARWARLDFRWY